MEKSARAEKIILQAPNWNFEGDCSLLSWMQEISQNLEHRATSTNQTLQQLSINVNRTAISVDNAANSLTALQYTQFVESRCHDDDETMDNASDVVTEKVEEQAKSSEEKLQTFLRNNLKMLHNCHEKFALNLEDSDEEEGANNWIYQPKNPYNDALLPHIYGSKLWKEHWHVGLCDADNEYSGDEISEAFSSSTSGDENESYESNTGNLSEWASSTSIPIESKHPTQITVHSDSPLRASSVDLTRDKSFVQATAGVHLSHNANSSDTSSTTSKSTHTNMPHMQEHDLFDEIKNPSIISNTLSSSARQQLAVNISGGMNKLGNLPPPFYETTPPNDLFSESAHSTSVNVSATLRTPTHETKRKPVNLFDDEDFNSFMTEVVDKAQNINTPPVPAARKLSAKFGNSASIAQSQNKSVNLFDETWQNDISEDVNKMKIKQTTPVPVQNQMEAIQKPRINLFDSPESSPSDKEPLFPAPRTLSKESNKTGYKDPITKTKITAKSLFDDDDDDDFLNLFSRKKIQQATEKTVLFNDEGNGDNDILTDKSKKSEKPQEEVHLFSDKKPLLSTPSIFTNKTTSGKENKKDYIPNQVKLHNTSKPSTTLNLFDELEKVSEDVNASSVENRNNTKHSEETISKYAKKPQSSLFTAKLFDDNDDDDDLFSKMQLDSKKNELWENKNHLPSNNTRSKLFENNVNTTEDDTFPKENKVEKVEKDVESCRESTQQLSIPEPGISKTNVKTSDASYEITVEPPALDEIRPMLKNSTLLAKEFSDNEDDDFFSTIKVKRTTEVEEELNSSKNDEIVSLLESNDQIAPVDALSQNTQQINIVTGGNPIMNTGKTATLRKLLLFEDENNDKVDKDTEKNQELNKSNLVSTEQNTTSAASRGIKSTPNLKTIEAGLSGEEISDTPENLSRNEGAGGKFSSLETPSQEAGDKLSSLDIPPQESTASVSNFSSIFLEEPPDDDDFFQTLSTNKKFSSSKTTLDLEHDLFEPALPLPPSGQKESHKTEEPSNIYSGLRLFSEIPPDDDDTVSDAKNDTTMASEQPINRLHSIFYDDFSETLEAVQQMNENKKIPTHSLFDDEPPPDEEFDIFKVTAGRTNVNIRKEDEIQSTVVKSNSVDVADRATTVIAPEESKAHSSTGKLQMPKININVQALLPGAARRPNFNKTMEADITVEPATDDVSKEGIENSRNSVSASDTSTEISIRTPISIENVNENVLSSLCKIRVRGPAKRRPSTRKARQENYHQALRAEQEEEKAHKSAENKASTKESINYVVPQEGKVVEQHSDRTLDVTIGTSHASTDSGTIKNIFTDKFRNDDINTPFNTKPTTFPAHIPTSRDIFYESPTQNRISANQPSLMPTVTTATRQAATVLFDDSSAINDDLFNIADVPKQLKKMEVKNAKSNEPTVPKSEVIKKTLLFDERSDDSDDNLFKATMSNQSDPTAVKNVLPQKNPIAKVNKESTLFDSDDDADFLTQIKQTNKTKSTLKDATAKQTGAAASSLFSDTESDEDDLFGGKAKTIKSVNKSTRSNISHTTSTISQKTTTSSAKPAKAAADNPLADLLDI